MGVAGLGLTENNLAALDSIGLPAAASYSGHYVAAQARLSRWFFLPRGWVISPRVTATITDSATSGYTTTGAGALNVHVSSAQRNVATIEPGLLVGRRIESDGHLFVPELRVGWSTRLSAAGNAPLMTSMNGQQSARVAGIGTPKHAMTYEARLDVFGKNGATTGFSGNIAVRSTLSHSFRHTEVIAAVKYRW